MGKKTLFVTTVALLTGALSLACMWTTAFAKGESSYLTCDCPGATTGCINASGTVPAGALVNLECASTNFPVSSTNVFRVPFFDGDVSTDSTSLSVASVEGTITFLDSMGNMTNFIDLGFTPYINAPGGPGAPPNNVTYGFVSNPNLSIDVEDLLESASFTGTTQAQINLQVFLRNSDSKPHTGATSMRVHLVTVK